MILFRMSLRKKIQLISYTIKSPEVSGLLLDEYQNNTRTFRAISPRTL
jgi:hypothetical protein